MGERIDVINSLRGIAILSVIWHHVSLLTSPGSHFFYLESLNLTLFPLAPLNNGWLGVNLFFILSGFVLFLPYANHKRTMDGRSDFRSFYVRRAQRLLPLFWFSLAAFIAIDFFLTGRIASAWHLVLYFTGTFNFNPDTYLPFNNWVLWSLGLEILFSVLFPFLVVLAARFSVGRLLVATLLLSLAVRYAGNQDTWPNLVLNPVKDSIFGRLDDFVVGMWLCQLYLAPPARKFSPAALLTLGVLAILLTCSCWDYLELGMLPLSVQPLLNNLFQLGTGCVVFALLTADRSRLRSILTIAPLQVLGMMTFSLYVWHARLIGLMNANAGTLNMVVYFTFLFVLSALTYRFIEFGYIRDWRPLFRLPPKALSE